MAKEPQPFRVPIRLRIDADALDPATIEEALRSAVSRALERSTIALPVGAAVTFRTPTIRWLGDPVPEPLRRAIDERVVLAIGPGAKLPSAPPKARTSSALVWEPIPDDEALWSAAAVVLPDPRPTVYGLLYQGSDQAIHLWVVRTNPPEGLYRRRLTTPDWSKDKGGVAFTADPQRRWELVPYSAAAGLAEWRERARKHLKDRVIQDKGSNASELAKDAHEAKVEARAAAFANVRYWYDLRGSRKLLLSADKDFGSPSIPVFAVVRPLTADEERANEEKLEKELLILRALEKSGFGQKPGEGTGSGQG
ncbi:MAG: hypothetical protein ABMB14_31500, partial [Myxococcota bacterium]